MRDSLVSMIIVLGVLVLWVSGLVLVAQSSDYFSVQPPSGAVPPAVIVSAKAPDNAQVCAATNAALVSCRSVGEFRQWVQERQQMNIQRSK